MILFSLFFSQAFSRRMRRIFASIRIIREGDYSHKMQLRGHDELAVLSSEFNALTRAAPGLGSGAGGSCLKMLLANLRPR
ncbi:MAG: hypothetical protein ACLU9S_12565 [Oscillospiraceae bacterium]